MSDNDGLWTADDIRKNAPNWSLYCDGKLLEYMKNLSRTIEERGNRTTHNLHSSLLELDRTKIVLENATNNLMALQHKQFVENRVYDDDETLANADNVPVVDADQTDQPNISAVDALRNAIEIGKQLVDQHFDKVTYELSDSEDDGDEMEKSVMFRPKNPYKHRPLPYLIGSKEWHEKWHIGLVEEDSDQSDNDDNEEVEDDDEVEEKEDVSVRSSPAISVSSNVPVSLTDSENPTGVIPSERSNAQDLFQSSSEENVSKLPHAIANTNLSFRRQSHDTSNAVQNAKRINDPHEINTNNTIFMPQKPQLSHAIPTLIDSDPPDLDDVRSRNAHRPPNLFLDDDENDEDDFMFESKQSKDEKKSEHAQSTQTNSPSTRKINSINLFADDDDNDSDNFDSFLPTTSKAVSQQKSEPIRNLFGNDDDADDDELFSPRPIESATKTIQNRSTILSDAPKKDVFQYNLFDDNPPEDDFESAPSKQSDSTVVQMPPKKTSNLFSTSLNLFADNDDDDDDDIFEKMITPSAKKQLIKEDNKNEINVEIKTSEQNEVVERDEPLANQSNNKSTRFNSVGLFGETPPSDDDELLFSGISKKVDTTKQKSVDIVKRVAKEFYNDFSETITTAHTERVESAQNVKTNEALQKPQKIDVPVQKPSSPAAETKRDQSIENETTSKTVENMNRADDGSQKGKQFEFMKKLDALSNVNEPKSEATVPVPKARQPKKLNIGSIDINVAALLPGAKRAKSVEKTDSKDISDDISSDDAPATSQIMSNPKTISQDNVDSMGRLMNLNRNRAKKLSRRPSTRAGRKHQYQKSMENEEHIDDASSQLEDQTSIMQTQQNNGKQFSPEQFTRSPTQNISQSPLSKSSLKDEDIFETNVSPKMTKDIIDSEVENTSISQTNEEERLTNEIDTENNPFSFLDDQENDEYDEFSNTAPKMQSTYTSTVSIKATPAYIDELPPELDPIEEKSMDIKNVKGTSLLSQNALSLFGEDEDDDFENDELFNTDRKDNQPDIPSDTNKPENDWSPLSLAENKTKSLASHDKQHQVSSTLSLFEDDNSGSNVDDNVDPKTEPLTHSINDLKSSESTSIPNLEVSASNLDELDNEPVIDKFVGANISKSEETSQIPPFSTTPSTSDVQDNKSPESDKKLPTSSILGLFDDEDSPDDADLFGSKCVTKSSNDSKDQGEKEKSQSKSMSTVAIASKTSLFGDHDDGDADGDLFGGPPPLPEPIKSQPKKVSQKIFSDDSSDDDLFGGGKTIAQKNLPKASASTSKNASIMPKTTKNTKVSEKLFSDSEDDDLFGGSKSKVSESASKKGKSTGVSKAIKDDPMKSVKMLSPSSVDNDPLADLLK